MNARLISFCASIPIGEVGGGAPGSDGLDDFSASEPAREVVESFPVSGSSATSGNGTENQKELPLGAWVSTPMEPPTCDKRWGNVQSLASLVYWECQLCRVSVVALMGVGLSLATGVGVVRCKKVAFLVARTSSVQLPACRESHPAKTKTAMLQVLENAADSGRYGDTEANNAIPPPTVRIPGSCNSMADEGGC